MALIANLVESFVAAFASIGIGFKSVTQLEQEDLQRLAEAAIEAVSQAQLPGGLGSVAQLSAAAKAVFEFSGEALTDPKTFVSKTLASWSRAMNEALAVLNVDSPEAFETLDFGNPEIAASALRVQGDAAGQRVAGALVIINTIVVTANAISVAAELSTLGAVKSIAEAVQSWVWANGIGGLSSMAYQPQLNASVFPWLNRLNMFKALATLPGEGDLVRFQLREVFEPERRAELLQGPERPTFDHYMRERGLSKYWADSHWAAHWVLPSIGQLNEMLFRGVISRERWEQFVRFNDFDPSSIPNLAAIIFNPFTRVDTRRMADLGVLDRDEQLQAYADLGNFAETRVDASGRIRAVWKENPDFTVDKAQALVVFTRLFNELPDLRARFKNGWLDSAELLTELEALLPTRAKAQTAWDTIVKADKADRVAPERELTRALVVRAWKKRLVSFTQALFLLQRLGWDIDEAELILRVQSEPDDPLAFVGTNLGARLGAGIGGLTGVSFPELEG